MPFESPQTIGRGGAGNFLSQQRSNGAEDPTEAKDLEAQRVRTNTADLTRVITSDLPEYLRTGRGGAGNVVAVPDSSIGAESLGTSQSSPGKVPGKETPTQRNGYSGRGGAGNWRQSEEEQKRMAELKIADLMSAVEARVKTDVEAGLRKPSKAYTST